MKKIVFLMIVSSLLLSACTAPVMNPLRNKTNNNVSTETVHTEDKNGEAWGYLEDSEFGEEGVADDWGDAGDIVNPDATTEGLQRIFFGYDSETLSDESREKLVQNAQWMMQNPSKKVSIEGHCDERGSDEYNLALGERRAASVLNYLKNLGVDENRMRTLSLGEEVPLSKGKTAEDFAKNRRVEFRAN